MHMNTLDLSKNIEREKNISSLTYRAENTSEYIAPLHDGIVHGRIALHNGSNLKRQLSWLSTCVAKSGSPDPVSRLRPSYFYANGPPFVKRSKNTSNRSEGWRSLQWHRARNVPLLFSLPKLFLLLLSDPQSSLSWQPVKSS